MPLYAARSSAYLNKISSPLLDRLDIQCEAAAVDYKDLEGEQSETSAEIKKRVTTARLRQRERFKNDGIHVNAHMSASMVNKYCPLGKQEQDMLRMVFDHMGLSMRAYHKILKISRTIADLEGMENINEIHLAEAISYRELDRKYWRGL